LVYITKKTVTVNIYASFVYFFTMNYFRNLMKLGIFILQKYAREKNTFLAIL